MSVPIFTADAKEVAPRGAILNSMSEVSRIGKNGTGSIYGLGVLEIRRRCS